jgi:hypothetical protein
MIYMTSRHVCGSYSYFWIVTTFGQMSIKG